MQDLPLVTQRMLLDINPTFRWWPTIDINHIESRHLTQTVESGQFCYMDSNSIDLVIKAVLNYGKVVKSYTYCGKKCWRVAANLWVPIGFDASTGDPTHKVTVRFCTHDWHIGTAYPGGVP